MRVTDGIKMMIYSPPGHGKTVLLGSLADDLRYGPTILADFESGLMSIKSKVRRLALPGKPNPDKFPVLGTVAPISGKVDVVSIKEFADFNALYEYLSDVDDQPYGCLAIDSLSETNYMVMDENIVGAIKGDSKHDKDIAEQRDYLRTYNQMRKLIRAFRDLDMNVVFSSLAQHLDDPRTKMKMMAPQLTGKLAMEMPGLIDVLGYLAIVEDGDEIYRYLMVQPTDKMMAKDRTEGGVLSPYIIQPTMKIIMDLIQGLAVNQDGTAVYKKTKTVDKLETAKQAESIEDNTPPFDIDPPEDAPVATPELKTAKKITVRKLGGK